LLIAVDVEPGLGDEAVVETVDGDLVPLRATAVALGPPADEYRDPSRKLVPPGSVKLRAE
jgi:hypothetical protein